MARLAFCDYHNMISILEKYDLNTNFHQIVDFVEASHLRRNLKLKDEAGISSLPDAELFKNLTLMGYNILPNQKFSFQKGQFSHQWKFLIHTIMQCWSPKSTGFNEFSSNIATALVCLVTNRVYNFLKMIFDGEGSGTPTEPHCTPSPEAQQTSPTATSSQSLPPVTTATIPTVIPTDIPQLRQYTRRARIAQSSALPTAADEPASPIRDDSQGEACPTDSGLEAEQDRANITKTSTLPSNSTPRVTSLAADEGSMQQNLTELTDLYTHLQRQQTEMASKKGEGIAQSGEDAPIKGRSLDEREEAHVERSAERGSDDTKEMVSVLTSLDAASILTSGVSVSISLVTKVSVAEVPTGSGFIPTASPPGTGVPIGSGMVARELEEQMARDAQRMNEQIARDAEIARIHAEVELRMMINGLDRNNETIAKYLPEYHQFAAKLPIGRRIELISDLVKYQDNYAKVLKLEQDSAKKVKTSEEVPKENLKEMMQLISVEEVYVEALQVKHPIIDREHFDRDDLNQLYALVKETLNIRQATSDKEKELWVELKRLYEPDVEDLLWPHTQNMIHAPVEWKLYDTCGVHHVISKDQEMFMLVEKDYPLRKGLVIVMVSYKLQVENYSQMANDLILKIHKIANSLRQQDD
nr:synaptobrevin, longin-like domain protein [Tanacetum cinerariifolium]